MPMASILDAVVREMQREADAATGMGVYMTYRSADDYMKPGARVRLGHIAPQFFDEVVKLVSVYKYMPRVCVTGIKFDIRGLVDGDAPTLEMSDLSHDMVRAKKCCGGTRFCEATIEDCFAKMRDHKCNDPLMARIATMMTWEKGQGK